MESEKWKLFWLAKCFSNYCSVSVYIKIFFDLEIFSQDLTEESVAKLEEIIMDSAKAKAVFESAKISMGQFSSLSYEDLKKNIARLVVIFAFSFT